MRVAIVVRSLKIGGMERVAVNLSEAFADAGHESHLIYFKEKNRVFSPKDSVHFHHFNLDRALNFTIIGAVFNIFAKFLNGLIRNSYFFYSGLLLAPVFRYKISQLEKEYGKFDLIIIRGHGTFEMIWAYRDKRVVQMVESVFIRHGSWLDNLYIKCVYSGKNLAGVSSGVKEKVIEVLKETNVQANSLEVVHNPLDVDLIQKKAEAYKPDIEESYIVSVGRITPNKKITFLIEAYHYARKYLGLTLPLVVVGSGYDLQNVKAKINERQLENHVQLLGMLENPYPWIKHASLLTSTSQAEGFGMVLVEALACGTKILSTKSKGGVKDIMVDELEGYMVDFSVEDFARKMVETISEKRELNFEKYTDPFLPESIVKRYIELYL